MVNDSSWYFWTPRQKSELKILADVIWLLNFLFRWELYCNLYVILHSDWVFGWHCAYGLISHWHDVCLFAKHAIFSRENYYIFSFEIKIAKEHQVFFFLRTHLSSNYLKPFVLLCLGCYEISHDWHNFDNVLRWFQIWDAPHPAIALLYLALNQFVLLTVSSTREQWMLLIKLLDK